MRAATPTSSFVLSRTFEAPRDVVWRAFTEPERMKQWWGPKGFPVVSSSMDVRPGGMCHYAMSVPDGSLMWGKFAYREIEAPERLVFVNGFANENGDFVRHPLAPVWPLEVLSVFRLPSMRDARRSPWNGPRSMPPPRNARCSTAAMRA